MNTKYLHSFFCCKIEKVRSSGDVSVPPQIPEIWLILHCAEREWALLGPLTHENCYKIGKKEDSQPRSSCMFQ